MKLPSDHVSKMNEISEKFSIFIFRSCVNRLERNDYISGGKYSGVDDANSYWSYTVWPSGFNRKLEPKSIILRLRISYFSQS